MKYLGHILSSDLCGYDDDEEERQCLKLYMHSNMLARKFYMGTDDDKEAPFLSLFCFCLCGKMSGGYCTKIVYQVNNIMDD